MIDKRGFLRTMLVATAGLAMAAPGLAAPTAPANIAEIAQKGFVYGLPIVMNYGIMYAYAVDPNSGQFKAPFNQLANEPRVFTWEDTAVVTPNSDTPYSFVWMDLRAEPMVLSVPDVEKGRYFTVQLIDGNTYNFGYIGSRATGNGAGSFMVVGPKWKGKTPAGIKQVFRSTTDFALAGIRTQLFNPADLDNVKKVQAGYKAQTLSAFLGTAAPPAAPKLDFPAIDKATMKTGFFDYLDWALAHAPEEPQEKAIRAELRKIGVGPGKTFDFNDLSPADKAKAAAGMQAGQAAIDANFKVVGSNVNNWQVASLFGDSKFYDGDWMLRATGAAMGIFGNDTIEAVYPTTKVDGTGALLDGSKHNYTITFPADALPPVNAFWSVTMYDGKTQLLIKNPIDRYLINSPMLPGMKRNADGSVTLYIQAKSPGADKEANWLPSPDGPIYLVMRLYWPKVQPGPSILPVGKGNWKPPVIVAH